jgi:hypothetical protein
LGGLGAEVLDQRGLLNGGLRFVSILLGLAWILLFPLWENEEPTEEEQRQQSAAGDEL